MRCLFCTIVSVFRIVPFVPFGCCFRGSRCVECARKKEKRFRRRPPSGVAIVSYHINPFLQRSCHFHIFHTRIDRCCFIGTFSTLTILNCMRSSFSSKRPKRDHVSPGSSITATKSTRSHHISLKEYLV